MDKCKIVGSPELEAFGGIFKDEYEVPFVQGITKRITPIRASKKFLVSGLARTPINFERTDHKWYNRIYKAVYNFFFSEGGIVSNLANVLIFLIIIVSIPLLIFLAIIWSLLQINEIDSYIYATNFNMSDVFSPSKENYWFDSLPQTWILYTIMGLSILFVLVGLFELV